MDLDLIEASNRSIEYKSKQEKKHKSKIIKIGEKTLNKIINYALYYFVVLLLFNEKT